jgi:hypothetical protein
LEDKVNTNYVSLENVNFVIAELPSAGLSAVETDACFLETALLDTQGSARLPPKL